MWRIIGLVIGYFVGCINFGYIIGHFRQHIDLRNYGSGNSGTTNAIRVMGWKLGLVTFLGDLLKSVIAYILIYAITKSSIDALYAGFGVILGHNWPIFLNFKGGKGIASTLGLIYAIDWRVGIIINLIMAVIILVTRYVSLSSLVMAVSIPIILFAKHPSNPEFFIIGLILMAMAFYRHKANIVRLMHGNENKLGHKKEG